MILRNLLGIELHSKILKSLKNTKRNCTVSFRPHAKKNKGAYHIKSKIIFKSQIIQFSPKINAKSSVKTAKTSRRNQKHAKKEKRDNTHETGKQINAKFRDFPIRLRVVYFPGFSRNYWIFPGLGCWKIRCLWLAMEQISSRRGIWGFSGVFSENSFGQKICFEK
jgi:hypothetical protein